MSRDPQGTRVRRIRRLHGNAVVIFVCHGISGSIPVRASPPRQRAEAARLHQKVSGAFHGAESAGAFDMDRNCPECHAIVHMEPFRVPRLFGARQRGNQREPQGVGAESSSLRPRPKEERGDDPGSPGATPQRSPRRISFRTDAVSGLRGDHGHRQQGAARSPQLDAATAYGAPVLSCSRYAKIISREDAMRSDSLYAAGLLQSRHATC